MCPFSFFWGLGSFPFFTFPHVSATRNTPISDFFFFTSRFFILLFCFLVPPPFLSGKFSSSFKALTVFALQPFWAFINEPVVQCPRIAFRPPPKPFFPPVVSTSYLLSGVLFCVWLFFCPVWFRGLDFSYNPALFF